MSFFLLMPILELILDFWREALSEQIFFAKQHQEKQQLKSLISLFYRNLEYLLTTFDIDAIVLTLPSISHKAQILYLIDQLLHLSQFLIFHS